MERVDQTGKCLCGAVTYTATLKPTFSACHCTMCRRFASGPYLAAGPADVVFKGEENITVYSSSAWAERGFCAKCGSSLFYRLTAGEHAGMTNMSLGTLDDPSAFELVREWYSDLRLEEVDYDAEHEKFTSAQIAEMFGA